MKISFLPFCCLSILTVVLSCALARAQTSAHPLDTAGSTQMVDVDGLQMRVRFAGLASRKEGSPVIILEAGLSNSLEVWDPLIAGVAAVAPVLAYDRSGMGGSAWDNQPPTPEHVTGRLRRLLEVMSLKPPYVLVGYSWGGVLVRYFAGYYPDDVAGIVYVDPGPIVTQSLADEVAPFDSVGAGSEGHDDYWSFFGSLMERRSPAVKAEFRAMRSLMERDVSDRDLRSAPDVPVALILSAKPFPPFMKVSFDQAAHYRVELRHRIRMLQAWALHSPKGTMVISNETTHAVPKEDPQLVIWAVKRVVEAVAD